MRQACLQYGYEDGCIVPGCTLSPRLHHMVPKREGGADGIHNLICICYPHEAAIHRAGAAARAMLLPEPTNP